MSVLRKLVSAEVFEGRILEARFMGPDLLSIVKPKTGSEIELPHFYIDVEAALAAGRRFVTAEEKEKAEQAEANKRRK